MATYILIAIVLGVIPATVAYYKGRDFVPWWFYGTALWIIALPHSILMTKDLGAVDERQLRSGGRRCPLCAEVVREEAVVCRFCGRDLPPLPPKKESDMDEEASRESRRLDPGSPDWDPEYAIEYSKRISALVKQRKR